MAIRHSLWLFTMVFRYGFSLWLLAMVICYDYSPWLFAIHYSLFAILRIKKNVMAFWAVSNCDAVDHREKYVEKLKEYIEVDVFSSVSFIQINSNTFFTPPFLRLLN